MKPLKHIRLASLVALLLTGCATQRTMSPAPAHQAESSYRVLPARHMVRYALPLGSTAIGATPIDHPAPVYPSAWLARCPPQVTLRALLIVDTRGMVSAVRMTPKPRIPDAFVAAVRTAARQWRFEPLAISRWAADANGDTHPVETVIRPFSLPYAFSFTCHDGKAGTATSADLPRP